MDLTEALKINDREHIAVVGGGGKTTIMFRLAAEALARGRKAVVGGTTRFTPPRFGPMPQIVLIPAEANPIEPVRRALRDAPVITCTAGQGDKGRWLPISTEQADVIAALPEVGLLVLEADGSRNRPFKAPGRDEPVIPASTTLVVAVAGLDVVGRPLDDESVHRPEAVARLTGMALGEPLEPNRIAEVLWHVEGGRKGLPPGARWAVVLNKAEHERAFWGGMVAGRLLELGAELVVATNANAEPPVVAVALTPNGRRPAQLSVP